MSRRTDWKAWLEEFVSERDQMVITKEQIDAAIRYIEEAEIYPEPPQVKRWKLVRKLHYDDGLSWPRTYKRASQELAGTDAAGSLSTMKNFYAKVEKLLREKRPHHPSEKN